MDAISQDLRDRALQAYDVEKQSRKAICARFKVSYSWMGKLLQRRRETGSTAAKPHTGNKPASDSERSQREAAVTELIDRQPDATLSELRDRLNEQQASHLSRSTVSRAVQQVDRPLKKSRCTRTKETRRG